MVLPTSPTLSSWMNGSQSTIYENYNFTWMITTAMTNSSNGTISVLTKSRSQKILSKEIQYGIFILNGILSLLGLLGNMFVCMIIIRGRKMYTIANLFLMNLAIADICVLVISYPLWMIQNIIPLQWPFGSAMCKIIPSISDAFYGVSLGCMTTISIHRYRMILHAMDSQLTFFQAKIIIILIWLVSLASISVPLYPILRYFEVYKTTNDTRVLTHQYCRSVWPSRNYEKTYQLFLLIAWYIIPLAIILATFLRIKFYLQKQMAYEWLKGAEHNVLIANHILGIRKALRMLAPVVIVFTILMLPWNALRLISVFIEIKRLPNVQVYILVGGIMLVANSVVNPFIYYIMSKEFRIEFRKQFWLLKNFLGLTKETDLYTIKSDTDGRRYVRRFQSITDYRRESNSRHYKSESNSTAVYKFSNGNAPPDYDELFREQLNSIEKNESNFGQNSNSRHTSHRNETLQLYNIEEELSADLESKDSGFENGNVPSDKNLDSVSIGENDVFIGDGESIYEEIIKETVL